MIKSESMMRTLFLDRDGVINKRIIDGYVTSTLQFELLPQVIEAMQNLTKQFHYIFIVTNQQGIGKGIFTETDLLKVHQHLLHLFKKAGISISKIYFAPQLASEKNIMRKPDIGMAMQAKKDYPLVDFNSSVMIGDSLSDMQFGKAIGAKTIWLGDYKIDKQWYNWECNSLYEASKLLITHLTNE